MKIYAAIDRHHSNPRFLYAEHIDLNRCTNVILSYLHLNTQRVCHPHHRACHYKPLLQIWVFTQKQNVVRLDCTYIAQDHMLQGSIRLVHVCVSSHVFYPPSFSTCQKLTSTSINAYWKHLLIFRTFSKIYSSLFIPLFYMFVLTFLQSV